MKKYKIHILVVMLIIVAALGTLLVQANDKSETGSNDIILNIRETAGVSEITSLTFSVDVKNVSDQAQVSVDFSEELPEKAIKKYTYKDKKLNIYIAGTADELFANEKTDLNIGTVIVDNDIEGAKKIKIALIPESVEFINKPMEPISFEKDEVELLGKIAEEPESLDEADKEALDSLIQEYSKLVESEYTQESWRNFEEVREEARLVLADKDAGQQKVDEMTERLELAFRALVKISDSSEDARASLENILNELNKLLSSEYTAESWNNLYHFMQQAQLMLDNGATKEELEDMLTKLKAAQSGLVKEESSTPEEGITVPKEEPSTPKEGITAQKPAQTNASDKADSSKTGDESNVMLWVILAVVAVVGAGIVLFVTKKKDK